MHQRSASVKVRSGIVVAKKVIMNLSTFRFVASSAISFFLCCANSFASDGLVLAGDVLQFALPAGAGGMTLGLRDWPGSLQLIESEGLTLATTYALKYGLDTRRPNGGNLSFPSGHA